MQYENSHSLWKALISAIQADSAADIAALAGLAGEDFERTLLAHDPVDAFRRTPLMWAYWWGKAIASTALVNAGSDYTQKDANGHDAAWYARRFGKGNVEDAVRAHMGVQERRLSMGKVIADVPAPESTDEHLTERRRTDI